LKPHHSFVYTLYNGQMMFHIKDRNYSPSNMQLYGNILCVFMTINTYLRKSVSFVRIMVIIPFTRVL